MDFCVVFEGICSEMVYHLDSRLWDDNEALRGGSCKMINSDSVLHLKPCRPKPLLQGSMGKRKGGSVSLKGEPSRSLQAYCRGRTPPRLSWMLPRLERATSLGGRRGRYEGFRKIEFGQDLHSSRSSGLPPNSPLPHLL